MRRVNLYFYKQTTLKSLDIVNYDLKSVTKKLAVSVRRPLDFIVWMLFFVSFSHNAFHRPVSIVRVHPQIVFDHDWHQRRGNKKGQDEQTVEPPPAGAGGSL